MRSQDISDSEQLDLALKAIRKLKLVFGLILSIAVVGWLAQDVLSAKTEIRTPVPIAVDRLDSKVDILSQRVLTVERVVDRHAVQDSLLRVEVRALTELIRQRGNNGSRD